MKDIVSKKLNLRCLLGLLEWLVVEFKQLLPGQIGIYYDCVLKATKPEAVPTELSAVLTGMC